MPWSCQIFWMTRAATSGPQPAWQVTMISTGRSGFHPAWAAAPCAASSKQAPAHAATAAWYFKRSTLPPRWAYWTLARSGNLYASSGADKHAGADAFRRGRLTCKSLFLHPSHLTPEPHRNDKETCMAATATPTISAKTGCTMPAIGFGTSQLGNCGEIVASALKLGYRNLD